MLYVGLDNYLQSNTFLKIFLFCGIGVKTLVGSFSYFHRGQCKIYSVQLMFTVIGRSVGERGL